MGRVKCIYYENAIYHVYNRGNNYELVFKDDEDKEEFIEVVARYKERDLDNLVEKKVVKSVAKSPTDPTKHYVLL